jgi:hypothetical protein
MASVEVLLYLSGFTSYKSSSINRRLHWRHEKICNHFASATISLDIYVYIFVCLSGTHFWCHFPFKYDSVHGRKMLEKVSQ